MTNSRKQYGIGSLVEEKVVGKPGGLVEPGVKQYGIFKKIKKGLKKVVKSPLGKIGLGALALGIPWGGGGTGGIGGLFGSKSAWGRGLGMLRNRGMLGAASKLARPAGMPAMLTRGMGGTPAAGKSGLVGGVWDWIKKNPGKSGMIGAGALGTALPFMMGGDEEDEVVDDWSVTSPYIDKIRKMARAQDPSLSFLPPEESVMSGYYGSKEGGIVGLANGGAAGNAQAEQMLRMEYQKYRNQGGTMSYQQFKMAVLQQAQGQGPMAQGQQAPQMAAYGGRMGYQGGELVEDASMVEATPAGMMEENVEEVQGEPTREQMEALAMEIFQLRLEELDEEQLMIVYQAAMKQQPEAMAMQEEDIQFDPQMSAPQMAAPQMAAYGGRMGYNIGQLVRPGPGRPGYKGTTWDEFKQDTSRDAMVRPGDDSWRDVYYRWLDINTFGDDLAQGGRVGAQEGGIMDLGGMEKDYRAEGGFVPLGGEERADDVPARLSKNEFVFTADAVRAAGGGDIDSGAEVMQNVMDNLEQGGQISEESQGAQDMYNNMRQLETRVG